MEKPKKILVIDDLPDNLTYLKIVLEKNIPNCQIFLTASSLQGFELAKQELPDTILLDVNLPEMSGIELCKLLKKNQFTESIPVFMVSAAGNDPKIRIDGLVSGADAFISRPFVKEEFIALVNTMLRNKEADDTLKRHNANLENQIKLQLYESVQHEKRLIQISDFVLEFFWEVDDKLLFTYLSPTVKSILGYTTDEVMWKFHLLDFAAQGTMGEEIPGILRFIERREPVNRQKVLCENKSGTRIWLVMSGFPFYNEENVFAGYRGVYQNITQRMREEEKHSLVINTSIDGFVMTDANNSILEVNKAFCHLTGYEEIELLGKKVMEAEIAAGVPNHELLISESIDSAHLRFETKLIKKNKQQIDVEVSINQSLIVGHQKFIFVRDISEKKRIEEQEAKNLKQSIIYQRKLKNLHSKLLAVEEKERKEMAAFLHDGIGQNLAIAYLKLSYVTNHQIDSKTGRLISESMGLIDQAIKESRMLTYDLSPPILHELGIVATLKWKLEKIENEFNIKTKLVSQANYLTLSNETESLLYRIFSELFNNIIKHAAASEIKVVIRQNHKMLNIEVKDNGKGFDANGMGSRTVGFGLFNIRERLESIQGAMRIDSEQNKGTVVYLQIPDDHEEN